MLVDLDMKAILGWNKSNIVAPNQRHIHSRDPEVVKKYRSALLKYWEEHTVEERM